MYRRRIKIKCVQGKKDERPPGEGHSGGHGGAGLEGIYIVSID